jgi:ferredoxin
MDMAAKFQEQVVFHVTGKRSGELAPIDVGTLRPALLAGYRDLTRLRYDFPLVLAEAGADAEFVVSLSALVNRLLAELAPRGIEGERLRKHVLRLERELRTMLAQGASGTLSDLWLAASERLAATDDTLGKVLAQAGKSLALDGEVADCDPQLPALLVTHAWRRIYANKARHFRSLVDQLTRKLSDIQRAAFARSAAGQQPDALRAAIGSGYTDAFDFAVMSKLVVRNAPKDELPPARRRRIEWALSVLRGQPFYPGPAGAATGATAYEFAFDTCTAALDAHRARLPRVVEVVKAIAVAELETTGAYVEADHDPFFERYDEHALTADDLAMFPDYLVVIPRGHNDAPENAGLLDMLSAGLPVKVLVQHTDLLEEASIGTGHFAFGVRSARLATTATGLGGMFVLQSTSADLIVLRERVLRGLSCRGPALFSVFSGSPAAAAGLPPYLTAAAATESRAFPAFSYDATAGSNWAARFSLEHNRNPDADWPVEAFEYADEALQRVQEQIAFTYADFVLCDRRYSAHFAVVPRERWNDNMLPVADWLQLPERGVSDRVPYLWAVDADDRLHRVIVDARLMQSVRRNLLLWHRLQEHAGINDSHAERLLARERAAWEAQKQQEIEALHKVTAAPTPAQSAAAPAGVAAAAGEAPATATEPAADKPPSDEAWIETARCPSCNECQAINDKMFTYNENKQATIANIDAGTYRQLVEAAEACQVAIIHPGKPRNPNEPGLDELLERAKPFL